MTLGTEWATLAEVKALIAAPYPTDPNITAALKAATAALDSEFCVTPADDDDDGLPDDWRVRRATAILAAQFLLAPKMSGGITDEQVEAETIGGYSYRTKQARSAATALRIDGHVRELVEGYLCPDTSGVYQLELAKDRHAFDYDDHWWEEIPVYPV